MSKVEFNIDNTAAIVTGIKTSAIITFESEKKATTAVPVKDNNSKMAFWGTDNDFPQRVIIDVRKDHELGPLLNKKAQLIHAGGITWGIPTQNDKNEEILLPLPKNEHEEVATWMSKSNINRYLMEISKDVTWFFTAFPELVLQVDRKKIIQICAQPAESCRFEQMDDAGVISNVFINANFPDAKENDKLTKTVPVIDPYYNPSETLRSKKRGHNFIYPISIPVPGCTYYQLAEWNGLREAGWLTISIAIPKFKKNVLEKQLNIKYHVEIADAFWPLKYPDWDKMTADQKTKAYTTELQTFSNIMIGVEGAGNSLVTTMKSDFQGDKYLSLWKITAIDNKLGKGEYLEDFKEASLAKMAAVGLHPALVGTMPSNGLGGAGSNIREAYNLNNIENRPIQDLILEPLKLVRDYNEWNPLLEFRIKNPFMTTLNTGTETKTSVA